MSEERDQEQHATYLAEQDAHEEALAQRAAEEEFEQQLAAAHRAGAREACAKLSEWALDAMEGEGSEAFTAYENCHVSAENLKARYAEPEESRHSVEISADMMDAPVVNVEYMPEPEEEKKG